MRQILIRYRQFNTSSNSYYEKTLATGAVRCIDDEIPFDIPQGWEWVRFRTITRQITDGTHSTPKYVENGVPFISVKDMSSGTICFNSTKFISEDEHKILTARCFPEKGDLLLSKVGTTGVPALVNTETPFSIFVSIALIKFFNKCLNSDYLVYMILSPLVQEQAKKNTRGVGNKNWVLNAISNTLLAIPSHKEQIRIVEKLCLLESHLNKYENLELRFTHLKDNLLDRLKQSILQEAIQGKLVPQIESEGTAKELLAEIRAEKKRLVKDGKLKKSAIANESRIFRGDDNKYYEQIGSNTIEISDEIPFDIPASWRWCRISSIFHINPKNEVPDDSEAAFVPMEAINPGYGSSFTYQLAKWSNIKRGYTHFADGDIAFAKITPCFQNRKSVIFQNLPAGIGAGTTELKVLRPLIDGIWREYVLAFLQSPYFIDDATFKGTANQQRIISGYVENKLFPLPPYEEQQRIVAQIEKLFEQHR